MRVAIIIFIFCVGLFSCKQKIDKEILSKEKMASVMYDLARADEYATNLINADTGRNEQKHRTEQYQKVFQLHSISKQTFQKSYHWYIKNPVEYKVVLDTLTETLKRPVKTPEIKPLPLNAF